MKLLQGDKEFKKVDLLTLMEKIENSPYSKKDIKNAVDLID